MAFMYFVSYMSMCWELFSRFCSGVYEGRFDIEYPANVGSWAIVVDAFVSEMIFRSKISPEMLNVSNAPHTVIGRKPFISSTKSQRHPDESILSRKNKDNDPSSKQIFPHMTITYSRTSLWPT